MRKAIRSALSVALDPFVAPCFHAEFEERPLTIYDVGASGGVFNPFEEPTNKLSQVYAFEPIPASFEPLKNRYAQRDDIEVRQVALTDSDGPVVLYEVPDSIGISSLFDMSKAGLRTNAIEVEGVRLESIPERFGFPSPDFIKLDTEGSELLILSAGRNLLRKHVLGVWVEISFWREIGEGVLFHQIDEFMVEHDFILFDLQINRSHFSNVGGKKDKLRSGDALYLKNFEAKQSSIPTESTSQRIALLKLIAICARWRYLDYALELLEFGHSLGIISGREFKEVASEYASVVDLAERMPNFPGRTHLATWFDKLSYVLHRHAKKGIPSLFNSLGNGPLLTTRRRCPESVVIDYPVIKNEGPSIMKTIELFGSKD